MDYKNILIIKMSALGDVMHALPCAAALRELYPNARITWIVHPQFGTFVPEQPIVDEVIYWDDQELYPFCRRYLEKEITVCEDLLSKGRRLPKSCITNNSTHFLLPNKHRLSAKSKKDFAMGRKTYVHSQKAYVFLSLIIYQFLKIIAVFFEKCNKNKLVIFA